MGVISSLAGMALILGLAMLLSEDRRAIRLRVVGAALALQAGFAVLVLYVPAGNAALQAVSGGVAALLGHAHAGVVFLFGPLARPEIGGASFAIAALPTIVFFATLIGILQHLGVMGWMVRRIGGALELVTGISRVESLGAAGQRVRRPVGGAAGDPALSGRAHPVAAVLRDDGGAGGGRRDDSRGLCRHRDQDRLSGGGFLHVGAGRDRHGEDRAA